MTRRGKLEIVSKLEEGRLNLEEAAAAAGVSERCILGWLRKYRLSESDRLFLAAAQDRIDAVRADNAALRMRLLGGG